VAGGAYNTKFMKKLLVLFFFSNVCNLYCQVPCVDYCLNFEDTTCLHHIYIDTNDYPENIWQIGQPQKQVFITAASQPNAIITDTINSYPANNHSVFMIRNPANMGDIYGLNILAGKYFVQTDSIHDYGTMEFSPDNGTTWIDLINDTVYSLNIQWVSQPKPVLTGRSNGWQHFDVALFDLGSIFNIQLGDTMLFRYTFISDSIFDNMDGLMFDDMCHFHFVEGISEIKFKAIESSIYPNPADDIFTIEFDNPNSDIFELAIYTFDSKLVFKKANIVNNRIVLDSKEFIQGTYVYKITNWSAKRRTWGKFIISR